MDRLIAFIFLVLSLHAQEVQIPQGQTTTNRWTGNASLQLADGTVYPFPGMIEEREVQPQLNQFSFAQYMEFCDIRGKFLEDIGRLLHYQSGLRFGYVSGTHNHWIQRESTGDNHPIQSVTPQSWSPRRFFYATSEILKALDLQLWLNAVRVTRNNQFDFTLKLNGLYTKVSYNRLTTELHLETSEFPLTCAQLF